jgi:PAS domain S-box-containing protein
MVKTRTRSARALSAAAGKGCPARRRQEGILYNSYDWDRYLNGLRSVALRLAVYGRDASMLKPAGPEKQSARTWPVVRHNWQKDLVFRLFVRHRAPDVKLEHRESEKQTSRIYTLLIQQMSDCGLFIIDLNGVILSWNPGVEKLLGYRESEWLGQSGQLIFTPEDQMKSTFQAEIRNAIETGHAADVRWHVRKNGSRIFIDGVLVSVRDETGSILCLAKLMRDATSRPSSQDNLHVIEERFRLAREGTALGIWDWDVLDDSIDASESYYRMMGMTLQKEPVSYEKWISLVHPWDRERIALSTRESLQTGDFDYEFNVTWPDGSTHWVQAKGAVQYANERPVRMVRVLQDVTAQKLSEHALRESEARNNAILRASLDAIILMNHEGILQEFNPAAEEMFGQSREDVIGKRLVDVIIPPRLRQQHCEGLNRYLLTGEAVVIGRHIETEGLRSDGTEFPVELAITRVPVGGAPLFAGYVRDISERRRTILALQRSNQELGEFAHVVAHDLRTPLRSIGTYAQLFVKGYGASLDEEGNEFLSLIRQSVGAMQALIEGLLRYAEVGEVEVTRESTDLIAVVNTVLTLMKSSLEAAGAEVIFNDLPIVESDPLQLQRVLQNLIGNAIKYRRQDPPRISIRSRRSSDCWTVSVSDNGEGIRPGDQERIFLPLKRLHGNEIAGSGLGLSICRAVMKRLGGRIWVESELGSGSTFYFTVPHSSLRQRSAKARD